MGIDGTNTLHVRGPPPALNTIIDTKACINVPHEPEYYERLRTEYFALASYNRISPNYMTLTYTYRNRPPIDYLTDLLRIYPMCWMKNEFSTDSGICGVWIARMRNGAIEEQECRWEELFWEENEFIGMDQHT